MENDKTLQKLKELRAESEKPGLLSTLFSGKKAETPIATTTNALDPQVKALTKAIREVESGNRFDARGASGEYGGYQFMPGTWEKYSREIGINVPLDQATRDQQTEVVYKKLKQWKDQGYNPGQIASMWNAGEGRPNAYKENWRGSTTTPDGRTVQYDTPAYAQKVHAAYQRLKTVEEAEAQLAGGGTDTPTEQKDKSLGRKGLEFLFPILEDKERTGLQTVADLGLSAASLVPLGGAANLGARALFGVGGKAVAKGLLPTALSKTGLATSAGSGYGFDVLANLSEGDTGGSVFTPGLGTALGVATPLGLQALRGTKLGKEAFDEEALGEAMNIVAPTMTKKNVKDALKGGLVSRTGKLGTEITPGADAKTTRAAQSIKDLVARGTIKAKDTVEKKVNSVRDEIGTVADDLEKQLKDMDVQLILQPEELDNLLANTKKHFDESELLVGDAGESAKRIFNRFVSYLPKGRDITANDILAARKKLDTYIRNSGRGRLFDPKTETAISEALREIRQGANELIAQKAPNVAVKELLARQSAMYDALDAIIENGWREVGTGSLKRFARKHPLISATAGGAVSGLIPYGIGGYFANKIEGN